MIGLLSHLTELPGQQRRLHYANQALEQTRTAEAGAIYASRRKAAKQGRG